MDIGKIERTYTVEPVENPVRRERETPLEKPRETPPVEEPDRELVPA